MKKIKIVFKILIPFIVGLLLITAVSIGGIYYLQNKNINNQAKEKLTNVSKQLSKAIDSDVKLFKGLIELLQKDKNVIDLFNNKSKDELFLYLSKIYISYKDRYDITHLSIHNANKINFLRVHDRDRHQDNINRKTLNSAYSTHLPSYGIEFGISHNLMLRMVYPLFKANKLIGYIELGKEIDKFTPELAKSLNADIIFTIKRSMINKQSYDRWSKKTSHNVQDDKLNNFYIIDSTVNNISTNLKKILNSSKNVSNAQTKNSNKNYYINSEAFKDISGDEIGKLYVLLDINNDVEVLSEIILKITLFILLIGVFLIYYYYKYIKKTENKLNIAYEKIHSLSVTDGMTLLYNKRFFSENVPLQIKRAARNSKYISLLLLDADNFKKYNDNHGHIKGDEVLISISSAMKDLFKRGNDACYRVGGEEFVVVFESDSVDSSVTMAKDLCQAIEELNIEHLHNSTFNKVTISIGICTLIPDSTTKLNNLYENADKALYISKESGRNKVTLFS